MVVGWSKTKPRQVMNLGAYQRRQKDQALASDEFGGLPTAAKKCTAFQA